MFDTLLTLMLVTSAQAGHVHEHGHGRVAIAVTGDGQVEAEFEIPGDSVYGFEHAPRTSEERAIVQRANALLSDPAVLLRFNDRAGCVATGAALNGHEDSGGSSHQDDGHPDDDDEDEAHAGDNHHGGGHSEVTVTVSFQCEHPNRIAIVGTNLFARFPRIEDIEGVLVTDSAQAAFAWTPRDMEYRLTR